jgi:hypothetical protein
MQGFKKTVTLAATAAALLMTPAAGASQTPPPSQPPATQPPATQPPATPPAQTPQQPTQQAMPPQQEQAQPDEQAARRHLTDARNTLSALTQLPEASQLTDAARTQVSQLISNFNELITAQSDWRASYEKVTANLNTLVGPDVGTPDPSGTAGAVGTTGGTGGIEGLDPAIRTKLVELRSQLKQFERAASGGVAATSGTQPDPAATNPTAPPATTPPTGTPPSTTPPATTPPTSTPPTGTTPPTSSTMQEATGVQTGSDAEVVRHIAAIEGLLRMQDDSGGLTLTKAQVEQLRTHWAALKVAIEKR